MSNPEEVLAYWLDEVGPKGWYEADAVRDQEIRDRFLTAWEEAQAGAFGLWLTYPSGTLAYVILNDQFPRNMFRDDGRAFASDLIAVAAAKMAIARGWDMKIDPPARQFFYLPLMHAENLSDQERSVRLFLTRMPESQSNLLHARAHREVIRRFGRFPHRNAALGRPSRSGETAFLDAGGYGATVRELQSGQASGG
jgi:uncharacterized protein (DUF924 family)